ncbi:hypothetical protein [Streptomyces sp. TS71-3]|uniref:hypothetical protein n=1 Tax=Streptomyces sp. TS71-3 TaxID=2733862 RepID=UPI001AFFFA68|nr:hypothetical protein [Streptomyces sp. TS71-3]GHJ41122.1 hypothetical protein Sm713_67310 [Streptomyces sp. TS71-3]
MRRVMIVLLACLGPAMPVAVATSAAASPSPVPATTASPAGINGTQTATCNSGYVCIYKGDIWDDSPNHPMVYSFYRYGTYNVQNLVGDYTVMNCQTGGAGVEGFTGSNGTGSVAWNIGNNCGWGLWTSLTSTYSVRLYA